MSYNAYHKSPVEELKHLLQSDPYTFTPHSTLIGSQPRQIKQEAQAGLEQYVPTSPTESNTSSTSSFASKECLRSGSEENIAKTVALATKSDSTLLCDYLRGSSVADTPAPSPSSDEETPLQEKGGLFVEIKPDLKDKIPEGVRLPQRKGGMQLWQFLYTLLEDNLNELIQYTSDESKLEFRLLEPDAVAIWWGYQKNRPNMNYDKLSRSLRYYYDKKIIQKVNGERYVYRFCCNPEYLYEALGNAESRPKLKEMPEAAKRAMEQNQNLINSGIHLPCEGTMLRAMSAEMLPVAVNSSLEVNAIPIHMHSMPEGYPYNTINRFSNSEVYPPNINDVSPTSYRPQPNIPATTMSDWPYSAPQTMAEPLYIGTPSYSQYDPMSYSNTSSFNHSPPFTRPHMYPVNLSPTTAPSYSTPMPQPIPSAMYYPTIEYQPSSCTTGPYCYPSM